MTGRGSFRDLLNELVKGTEGGVVRWEETLDEDQFRTHLGGPMVRVGRNHDALEDAESYFASLLTREAKVAESLVGSTESDHRLLRNLFELARRSARKPDDLLDQAFGYIDRLTHAK